MQNPGAKEQLIKSKKKILYLIALWKKNNNEAINKLKSYLIPATY